MLMYLVPALETKNLHDSFESTTDEGIIGVLKHEIAELAKFVKMNWGFHEIHSTNPIEYRLYGKLASAEKYNSRILLRATKLFPHFDKNTKMNH